MIKGTIIKLPTIFRTRSQRIAEQTQVTKSDIYSYEKLPQEFRTQVVYIWMRSVGTERYTISEDFWRDIYTNICEAKGTFQLIEQNVSSGKVIDDLFNYFILCDVDNALDLIELAFQKIGPWQSLNRFGALQGAEFLMNEDAIRQLNARFEQHLIGYEFTDGYLIRKDSKYIHNNVTMPAIQLLHEMSFKGASNEFINAQEHYKNGKYKESCADALKAFESTMKSICDVRNWAYDKQKATAKELINIILKEELVPIYLQDEFCRTKPYLPL